MNAYFIFHYFRSAFRPFGIKLGLRASIRRQAPTNDVLEQAYTSSKTKVLDEASLLELSSKLGMTVRQIERWLRIRRTQNKPSTLDKFAETG